MDWGGAHEASLLTKQLLATNGYWGGDSIMLRGVAPGGCSYFSGWPPHHALTGSTNLVCNIFYIFMKFPKNELKYYNK